MKKLLLITSLLFSLNTLAAITELKSYKDLNTQLFDKDTLVIFDIDNTILRQDSVIGTHQWGDYMRERAIRTGMPQDDASRYQHEAFAELQPYLRVVLIEEEIKKILKDLENRRVPHFALTARAESLKNTTISQLTVVNHSFAKNFPMQIDNKKLEKFLKDGVVFSGGVPKGELLKTIIENSQVKPKKIVFIDDKLYNLESVEKSMAEVGINLTSYRYGAADKFVTGFDPVLADIKYSFFKETRRVLSDDELALAAQNIRNLLKIRFELYLWNYDFPISGAKNCEEILSMNYRCYYFYGRNITSVDFSFARDSFTNGVYFGGW